MSKYVKNMKIIILEKLTKMRLGESNQGLPVAGSPPERYATESSHKRGQKTVPVYFGSAIVMNFINQ